MDILGLCIGLIFIIGSIVFGVGLRIYDNRKEVDRLKEMSLSLLEFKEELEEVSGYCE